MDKSEHYISSNLKISMSYMQACRRSYLVDRNICNKILSASYITSSMDATEGINIDPLKKQNN